MTGERCTVMEDGSLGCIRSAGHTGRHKIRRDPDSLFGGGNKAKAPKARKEQFLKSADEAAEHLAGDEKADRIAALCEIATAMGMVRVANGDSLAWINPQTGAAAMLEQGRMELHAAKIVPDGAIAAAEPWDLMSILGVQIAALADGDVLYVSGGKMIVQTPSGGLRPATLNKEPALGPAGDGEGR